MLSWNQIQDGITIFMGIFIGALPFILIGVLVSALINKFVKTEWILRVMPKNRFGRIIFANLVGFLFPVCECGNVPVARRLVQKGVPPYAAVTFLLSAPVINPVVIFATYVAFKNDLFIFYGRFILTFLIAGLIGLILSLNKDQNSILKPSFAAGLKSKKSTHTHQHANTAVTEARQEFLEMTSVLSLGSLIASIVQIAIPRTVISALGSAPIGSVLAMTFLAFITSICSNVDSFFALGFVNNFTQSSILAFLVLGPMLDIKALLMMTTTFKTKAILGISFLILQFTLIFTLYLNLNIS
jgi:hypothetical protein